MQSSVRTKLTLAAAGLALALGGYAVGVRAEAGRRAAPHGVCIRPSDVTPTPGSPTLTVGLHDALVLDHTGEPNPNAGYTDAYRLKLIRQTYAPGGTHHAHHHELAEQAYYILDGRAKVRLGDSTYVAGPGTVFYIPPGTEHQLWNIGKKPLVNLLIDVTLDRSDLKE